MNTRHSLWGILFLPCLALASGDLTDATQVIQEIRQSSDKPAADAGGEWPARLAAFPAGSKNLPPAGAGDQWVALVTEWKNLPPPKRLSPEEIDARRFDSLVKVIPGPASWDAIHAGAARKPLGDSLADSLLALYAATLVNDESAKWSAFQSIPKNAGQSRTGSNLSGWMKGIAGANGNEWLRSHLARIASALVETSDDPNHLISALEAQLDSKDGGFYSLTVPDLVTMAGEKKARALLEKALTSPFLIDVKGRPTQKLARQIALENIDRLQVLPWRLINGIDESNLALYSALAKKDPGGKEPNRPEEYYRRTASGFYLLGLIANGKTKEASRFVLDSKNPAELNLPYGGLDLMRASGRSGAVYEFLFQLLETNPDLPFWRDFLLFAAEERKTQAAVELAQKALARPQLPPRQRAQVLQQVARAYLAHGEIDQGIAAMRERLKILQSAQPREDREIVLLGTEFARLGQLLAKPDLTAEGLDAALEAAGEVEDGNYYLDPLGKSLLEAGRTADLQKLWVQQLEKAVQKKNEPSGANAESELANLAGLYEAAGRNADVLVLLSDAPWWGRGDLAEIVAENDFRDVPLGLTAARALAAGGDRERAQAVVEATLRRQPRTDAGYALLIELTGEKSIPFLDELVARDRFEERPLIWKAVLQLRAGQIDVAEKTIRAAIAIDPSDGEMGPGDRMRAYAVLADVLEAQGKTEDAKLYRGAVAAIRLSEEADKYLRAGLLSEAVTKYEEALLLFSDAYCIQSRLAIQFMKLGEVAKAETHYLKAYELMPDSFGRVESHCFGCERAFDGELAESLAEKTFRRLIAENPSKPQLHYLLGYLRYEQHRYSDALEHFRKAVELDPDYLNAWKKILEIGSDIAISQAVRDEATLALLRLDPFSAHTQVDLQKVADLKAAWNLLEGFQATLPPAPSGTLLPLTASAAAPKNPSQPAFTFNPSPSRRDTLPGPHAMLMRQAILHSVSELLTQIKQRDRS